MARLTAAQATRLQDLIASGPFDRKEPVDSELIELGWAQLYDDTDAIEARDDAAKSLYDANGCIHRELLPESWKRAPQAHECANGMEHQNCNDNACECACHKGEPWRDINGVWHNLKCPANINCHPDNPSCVCRTPDKPFASGKPGDR